MMAENMDSDTCVGSKGRITDIEETLLQQLQELPDSTQEDSKEKESFLVASSAKEEQEIIQGLTSPSSSKKVNCFLTELSSSTGDNHEMLSSIGEEKAVLCDLVSGSFGCEENSEDFARKSGNYSLEVQETKDSMVGFVYDVIEETVNDLKGKKGKETICGKNEEFDGSGVLAECKSTEVEVSSVTEQKNGFSKMEKMEAESLLEAKKKQLLEKVEAASIFKDKIGDNALGFDTAAGILGGMKGIDESVRRSLKVEVIDDTALIATVPVPKIGDGCVNIAGKKNEKQEAEGKRVKRPRRKGKDGRKDMHTGDRQNKINHDVKVLNRMFRVDDAQNCRLKNGDHKMKYNREEMEGMRFFNIVEQRKLWRAVYAGLGDVVVREYNDLASSRHQKNVHFSYDPCQRFGRKKDAPGILGKSCSEYGEIELENTEEDEVENSELLDSGCCENTEGKHANAFVEEESNEEDDSDEDYGSIQRPAFLVEGEPDFDSGPPEDGLEYLRRVRWEAAHIPKVAVAEIDRSNFLKEQSIYMPQIPEIDRCPEHLLPSKQWEDAFLADFSELRKLLSYNEDSSTEISCKLKSLTIVRDQNTSCPQLSEGVILETFNNRGTDASCLDNAFDQPSVVNAEGHNTSAYSQNTTTSSVSDSSCNYPTLSAILAMDTVARVSMLRKRISLAETLSTLSKIDCIWLFALCAAVDTPVGADTCAALRSLLRKCASLRAAKSELDDEVIMLNILATISGRYFGQAES